MVPFFYVRTLERIHIALGDMFNDIYINKYDDLERTKVVKTVKVPLIIGNYDKNFANFIRNSQKKRNMPVPIMGLRFTGLSPRSGSVPQPHYVRSIYSTKAGKFITDAQPKPYDITYTLDIFTESMADYGQIVENIMPYFNNFRTLRLKEFQEYDDLERKIPVYFTSPQFNTSGELQRGSKQREITQTITLTCKADLYRPRDNPNIIEVAQLTLDKDGLLGDFPMTLSSISYPTELATDIKKPWETISDSIIPGYSVIGTYEDPSSYIIPNFLELDLRFDEDTDFELDFSPWNRNFLFVRDPVDASRVFDPDMEPDGGNILTNSGYSTTHGPQTTAYFYSNDVDVSNNTIKIKDLSFLEVGDIIKFYTLDVENSVLPTGISENIDYYIIENNSGTLKISETSGGTEVNITAVGEGSVIANSKWNMLLSWFGSNNGLMGSPYVFKMSVKITEDPITATVFQHMWNKQVGQPGDDIYIPANSVWYIWGLDSEFRPYFTFRTYGENSLYYTFKSDIVLDLNNEDVFTFMFTLTNEGYTGVHSYRINNDQEIKLLTSRT